MVCPQCLLLSFSGPTAVLPFTILVDSPINQELQVEEVQIPSNKSNNLPIDDKTTLTPLIRSPPTTITIPNLRPPPPPPHLILALHTAIHTIAVGRDHPPPQTIHQEVDIGPLPLDPATTIIISGSRENDLAHGLAALVIPAVDGAIAAPPVIGNLAGPAAHLLHDVKRTMAIISLIMEKATTTMMTMTMMTTMKTTITITVDIETAAIDQDQDLPAADVTDLPVDTGLLQDAAIQTTVTGKAIDIGILVGIDLTETIKNKALAHLRVHNRNAIMCGS
jgi:hypothetical protein